MRNSELRPHGSTPLPEAHAATEAKKETNHVQDNGQRGRGLGRWHGRGRGHYHPYGRGQGNSGCGQGNHYGSNRGYQSNYGRGRGRGRGMPFKPQDSTKSVCYRCGMSNHWAKTCRTPKLLTGLYQESLKGKNLEAHLVYQDGEEDFDHEILYLKSHCIHMGFYDTTIFHFNIHTKRESSPRECLPEVGLSWVGNQ
ncbi:hypothetical protein N665_0992s0008 [Sinapis alba]|nr:hypothetical protein N665_0992s0008 [Sinapis alba]